MESIVTSIVYLAVSCVMLFLSKYTFDKFSPFKPEEQVQKANHTAIIAFCGYIIGVALILIGAFVGPSKTSFSYDLGIYMVYAIVGIALMCTSGYIVKKVMLNRFDNTKELLQDNNIGTAAVYFGFYISSGMIIAACVNGEYGGILSTLFYYVMGMVFMFLFLKVYDKITPYSIHDELEQDNYSVGIALCGNIIAIGLILMKATLGDVSDWKIGLSTYFLDLAAILLLLPTVRYFLGNFIVKSVNLNEEIQKDNVAAALVEFTCITCFALLVFFMVDFSAIVG